MTTSRPFHNILIANRGEIALRVIRTARMMGYRTVAVYSRADEHSPHVLAADQAVFVGESEPAASYLNIDALIEAARRAGADAVHPGYGFLAESEAFARACEQAGLVFIGPSADAIGVMGNKAGAKALMIAAGVPCIPGYQGQDQSDETLVAEADKLGFPVMIKAVAGGGGRGMRRVETREQLTGALHSARSEAAGAFGDSDVILERALSRPRHIEIQVFADRHGNCVHLGERDCSVQRRHQKLIEEAPSPAVSERLRAEMGQTALNALKAIAYEGAGTLEFLLDTDGSYYFMEMNTRLQVEHPVTEAICGLDLVEWQLRVAAGEPLPLSQEQIQFNGHAIEVRLCAEDPANGFMPQSGRLLQFVAPSQLRVEHALEPQIGISPHYDSMLAKLIAHGDSREQALRRLLRGLQDLIAIGVTTNQAYLARCLEHPVFRQGQADTGFIDNHLPELPPLPPSQTADLITIAAVLFQQAGHTGSGRRLAHRLPVDLLLSMDDRPRQAVSVVQIRPGLYEVGVDNAVVSLELLALSPDAARVRRNGVDQNIAFATDGDYLWLSLNGSCCRFTDYSRAATLRDPALTGGDGQVRASTNGRVVAVVVEVGQKVQAGQSLVTIEAMKMEHAHTAPVAGVVRSISVAVGEQVPASRTLVSLEPDAGDQSASASFATAAGTRT